MVVSTKLDIALKRAFKGSAWIVCKILPECECKLQTQKGSNRVKSEFRGSGLIQAVSPAAAPP